MWQRFSEYARKSVFFAQEEAQRSGDAYVNSSHLLLGTIHESGADAFQVLSAMEINPVEIRQ